MVEEWGRVFNFYFVPGSVLRPLSLLSHLILATICEKSNIVSILPVRKIGSEMLSNMSEVT